MSPFDLPNEELLDRLLRFDLLHVALQPVFNLRTGEVFGFESLIRGPASTALASPVQLFAEAEGHKRRYELELRAAQLGCRHFASLKLPGYLLLNFSCMALETLASEAERLMNVLQRIELSPNRVIVELTEHDRVNDPHRFAATLQWLRASGIGLALDDFGSGHSNLHLWMELRPRLVKLDKTFVQGVSGNGDKFEIVRLMKGLADSFGTELVAEGIEDSSDLAAMHEMGIKLGQGFALARPEARPATQMNLSALAVLQQRRTTCVAPARRVPQRLLLAGELSIAAPTIAEDASNEQLAALLRDNPALNSIAVTRGDVPVGLINRRLFMDQIAQPFYREIYGRRKVTVFMNASPVIVDRRAPLETLMGVLAGEDQRYLHDGFIVTDYGSYVGLGTGESLVRAVSELRVEAARYANPLTFLPGNVPISEQIKRLLANRARFTVCYADLSNFKPFNDQYGYWRGDEVIRLAATTIQAHASAAADFIGHIGGDDFFVLFQSEDWRERCGRIVGEFNLRVRDFFGPAELAAGGFSGEDRRGQAAVFPLTSMVMGAVPISPGCDLKHEQISLRAALAKRQAKRIGTTLYVLPESDRPA